MMSAGMWCAIVLTLLRPNLQLSQSQLPTLLFSKIVQEECASFEVFDHGDNESFYTKSLTKRDDAAFYYSDEDQKEVIIQKKSGDDQYILKYIFIAHKKTYEIVLKSCAEHLVSNKKELYNLQQKLLKKENL